MTRNKQFTLILMGLILVCTLNFLGSSNPLEFYCFNGLDEDSTNMELEHSNGFTVYAAHTDINSKSSKQSSSPSYTIAEIGEASQRVKNYVETNHQLPNYVDIKSRHVTMPEYLFIATTAVKQDQNRIKCQCYFKRC